MAEFSDEETPRILSLELLGIRMNENEKVKDFNERVVSLLNRIPIKPVEVVQIEYYVYALPPNIAMFVKTQRKVTLVDNFAEAIQVEKDFETLSSLSGKWRGWNFDGIRYGEGNLTIKGWDYKSEKEKGRREETCQEENYY